METFVWIVHVLAAVGVIGLVLLQQGKGADMGAAFGSGASGSLFGSSGSANFLSRATAILAAAFFITSLTLTYFSGHRTKPQGVMATHKEVVQPAVPEPAKQAVPMGPPSKAGEIPK